MSSEKTLAVFSGGIFRDLVATTPKFPGPGETVMGDSFFTGFGGKCSNQAVMCRLLGARVAFVGKLGDDDHGAAYRDNFARLGIDATHVKTEPGCSSGVAPIFVNTRTGENEIIVVPGANARMSADDVERASGAFAEAAIVVCALEMNMDAIAASMKKAKACGAATILNAAPAREDLPDDVLSNTDVLVVNETEAEILSGLPIATDAEIEAACLSLLSRCPTVIATLGAAGAIFATKDQPVITRVPVDKVDQVVDTTGAGDAFVGALAYYLVNMKQLSLAESIRRSCCIASMSVQRPGTQASFPRREEIKAELLQ